MKKKPSSPTPNRNLPVSKQTAGGVTGAVIGGVIAGPVGAVAGAIAGTIMGNRAAEGKSLVSSAGVKKGRAAVKAIGKRLPSLPVVRPQPKRSKPKAGAKAVAATKPKEKKGAAKKALPKKASKPKRSAKRA